MAPADPWWAGRGARAGREVDDVSFVLIGVAVLAAALLLVLLGRKSTSAAPTSPVPPARTARPAASAPATPPARPVGAERSAAPVAPTLPAGVPARAAGAADDPLPTALDGWSWASPDALPAARREALVASLRNIPRPPNALHQLISPQFLERANSGELSDLISAEAQLAAKVLATVNSPLYGLQRPVASIGQAVTFLGLNTVRTLCVTYLLDDSFKPGNPALKQAYQQIWTASALASELCGKLALKLWLPEPGTLVTQVLLSFLGHLATASMLSRLPGSPLGGSDLTLRVRSAQERLGLGAGEIGGLLLQEWGLPATIVDEVRATDRLLVTPAGMLPAERSQRLALAYLCARLGERLALGELSSPGEIAPLTDPHPDFHFLRGHLASPALARLPEFLQAADLNHGVQTLMQGLRGRG